MGSLIEARRRIMQADILPPQFQRVEFVKTDGHNSYFDTGVAGDDNSLQFDVAYTVSSGYSYGAVLGNYDGNRNHSCWTLRDINSTNGQNYLLNCGSFANGQKSTYFTNTIVDKLIKAYIEYMKISFIVDGVTYSDTATEYAADVSKANIFVGNFPAVINYGASHSFYGLKIRKQGILIRNYIPCYRKSDNKAGMYDLVNHTFNPSTGAADFILP